MDSLHPAHFRDLVKAALAEDLGQAGDLTSAACLPAGSQSVGSIVARKAGVVAGLCIAAEVFRQVDPTLKLTTEVGEGATVRAGEELMQVHGATASILAAERTALNFLGHLSGIATTTRALVDRIHGTRARIVCTRKTAPTLRALEKFAVRCGGGMNHRFGLYDAVLIKDNHRIAAGGIRPALDAARKRAGHLVKIEIEVDDVPQLQQALDGGADVIMLDNMSPAEVTECVRIAAGKVVLEASGGITLETVRAYAETGVDLISVGWITHSAPNLDVSLDLST
ncbi:MAG: carboxylating nicotinate-nucleotide diphosphorylase [Chthonomonas sp.]|nr:carboxylating nicotinate-nucleotide diphosphorylase [Chthonomonas sp.]